MPTIIPLNPDFAISLWNKFLATFHNPVPFSFNPSLFDFYTRCFYWKPYYFMLFSEEKLLAVCPVVNTGRSWVSLPHFSYGGFAGIENDAVGWDEKLIRKLIVAIQKEEVNPGFFHVDVESVANLQTTENRTFIRTMQKYNSTYNYMKVSSFIALSETNDSLFFRLNANLRRKLHKAAHSGFDMQIGDDKLLNAFYDLYSIKMHQLGSPAYGKRFFQALLETYRFGERNIFLIRHQGKVVGTALLLSYHGFYESAWFATHPGVYKYYVSDFLHWQMIQFAIEHHAKVYSFGRSTPQGGVYQYKNHWPVKNIPVYQYGYGINSHLRNYHWLSTAWKIIPYFIAQPVGPLLVRHIY